MDANERKLINAVLDPSRFRLIMAILHEPKYLSQLAAETKMDRGTVTYHLNVLEDAGLVGWEYRILEGAKSRGKAARFYSINEKRFREALNIIERNFGALFREIIPRR